MDALTYKCPGCGNNLLFDAKSGLFLCGSCNQYYKIKNETKSDDDSQGADSVNSNIDNTNADENSSYMDIKVYHCSSCGSEIMTNDVEVSKFCSYCGQSAIMYDRVSREKKPQKIIPFVITKEKAIELAREKFSKGKYSFNSIHEVTTDSVYGIYMPYWCCHSKMSLKANVTVQGEKNTVRKYEHEMEEEDDILLDASKRFRDAVSIQLNPYDMMFAEDFNMGYLSGYYADRSDVNSREEDAPKIFRDELKEKMLDKTPGVVGRAARDMYSGAFDFSRRYEFNVEKESYQLVSTLYMFIPVYFITFKVNDKTVIILVNGQSGKVFGNVPIDKKKFNKAQMRDRIIWSLVFGVAGALCFRYLPVIWAALFIGFIAYFVNSAGEKSRREFLRYYKETNSEDMFDISKNREG